MSIKMTEKRKEIFREFGHPEDNMRQLAEAMKVTKYTLETVGTDKEKRISADKAFEILGERKFLSGISRSAFHYTSARDSEDGKYTVHFDSSKLFR